ncbi:MAG TPA: chemotaxis protein CheA [Planctomycetaceae bacterium]|nr:chemotaxis protein CheA [Planctomycetaceae bacterium]
MQVDLNRFRAAFFIEADEHLQHMEAALLQLESASGDTELLNTIFRAAHTIKGGSTTFGIDEVGKFTHVLENLLERLRDGELTANSELVELLLSSVDVIYGLVSNAKDNTPLPENLHEVFLQLQRVNGKEPAVGQAASALDEQSAAITSGSRNFRVKLLPSRTFFHFGQDPLLLLRELSELGTVLRIHVDDSQLPSLAEMDPEACYLSWVVDLQTANDEQSLHEVFMFLDSDSKYEVEEIVVEGNEPNDEGTAELAIAVTGDACNNDPTISTIGLGSNAESAQTPPIPAEPKPKNEAATLRSTGAQTTAGEMETVRVDRQRLDDLINQIGELVIGASMVEQEVNGITGGRSLESLATLGKVVRDLQEMSLGLRMVPIAATFQKMNRVLRDIAKKVNKKIDFITEGDDTELDKTVVDQISDPLIHMVRNAADHGIETPQERIAAGKSEVGKVRLCAFQQGGNVYVELHDDGRGLNRKRIYEKAVEKGLIAPDAILSDAEICSLIFQAGFSTAKEVTDISGRGVGMDVVRRNVEALQGSVSIRSEEGKGSVLTVRLPLTLAILDGLLIRLSDEVFVIPLLTVVESICVPPREIKTIVGFGEVIQLRGEVVPLLRLHHLLDTSKNDAFPDQNLVVIVEDQGRRLALKVDELLGQQQVVIKNLETNFRKVPGVAGATILGDGRVALILDVYGVSTLASNDQKTISLATSSTSRGAI